MLEKISEKEIKFMEMWHTPKALIETLFSNFDNLTIYDEKINGEIRMYQLPMINNEPLIDFRATVNRKYPKASKDEKRRLIMKMRKKVGDINNIGARGYGKTLTSEKLDVPISMIHDSNTQTAFGSPDGTHIRVLSNTIINAIENHPILKFWKQRCKSSHPILITAKNGWVLNGVNSNVKSKSPGANWAGLHAEKIWIEEISLENNKASEMRKDAKSDVGAIHRISGMTDFVKNTPADKAFKNKEKLLNLPQYVKSTWSDEEEEEKAKDYGGRESPLYKVYVEGEVIDDGISSLDMEEIEKCYNRKKKIKRFELRKEQYKNFRRKIVVERPKNCDRIFICADAGDGEGGTNVIIIAEHGNKYKYLYNIVLYKMKKDWQREIFDYLIENLKANVIAVDCGDGFGRALMDDFEKIYPKENLVRYSGNDKVVIGIETDEKGNTLYKNGQPIFKEEFHSEWSMRRLKSMFYDQRIEIPRDDMLDNQLTNVVSAVSGTRTIYACNSETGDHLWSAWKVFFIAQWLKKDFNATPEINSSLPIGATSITVAKRRKTRIRKLWYRDFIYKEKPVECPCKEDYINFVRNILLEFSEELKTKKEKIERFKFCTSEIERLDNKFLKK